MMQAVHINLKYWVDEAICLQIIIKNRQTLKIIGTNTTDVSYDKVLKASPTDNRHLQWILMRLQQLEVTNQKPAAIQIWPNNLECNSINYT